MPEDARLIAITEAVGLLKTWCDVNGDVHWERLRNAMLLVLFELAARDQQIASLQRQRHELHTELSFRDLRDDGGLPESQISVGWQPIETAPRMRTILLFAVTDIGDDGTVKNWKMATGSYHTGYDDERSKERGVSPWEWDGHQLKVYEAHPTHWMPLPTGPADV